MPSPFLSVVASLALWSTVHPSQDPVASVATIYLADGTNVALVEWKLTYEFATWRQKEQVSSAKAQVRESATLVLGKKSYPVKADTLTLTHVETDTAVRVVSMNLNKVGNLRVEPPARELVAPDIDKNVFFQPRSLDLSGKTLSGVVRSFCVASLSALVECGGTKASRVIRVDFN